MIIKDNSKAVLASFERASEAALEACAIEVEGRAVLNLRANGSIDTGRLMGSITWVTQIKKSKEKSPAKTGDGVQSIPASGVAYVGTNVEYAAAVEFGSKPHMPPSTALRQWAKKKLGDADLAYVVARKIATYGTSPKSFLRSAADESRKVLPEIYKMTFDKVFGK